MKDRRVLLVEDEAITADITAEVLRCCSFDDIVQAENGVEALSLMQESGPEIELIVTDLRMPKMDGVEFLRHLSEIDRTIPVILLSGTDRALLESAELLAQTRCLNVLGALEKPIRKHDLLAMLEKDQGTKDHNGACEGPRELTVEDLRYAIAGNDICLYYQPKILVSDQRLQSVEGLARWHHAELGIISPVDFISLAERSGMIDELTEHLCRHALDDLTGWRSAGLNFTVALNFSVESLHDLLLPERLGEMVRLAGLQPSDFILEVTESGIVENLADCLEVLMRLRMQGFALSIDDFGTGHSSMQQLQRFPFTELKVDRAFVGGAAKMESARAIFESNVALARKLGLKVVAEGVETQDDWGVVQELNCDLAQGYLFSKPVKADKISALAIQSL